MDHNTNEEPIGAAGEVPDNNVEPKSAEITADKTTDDQDAVSEGVPHDEESLKEEAQKTENAMKQFPFLKSIPGLAKVCLSFLCSRKFSSSIPVLFYRWKMRKARQLSHFLLFVGEKKKQ